NERGQLGGRLYRRGHALSRWDLLPLWAGNDLGERRVVYRDQPRELEALSREERLRTAAERDKDGGGRPGVREGTVVIPGFDPEHLREFHEAARTGGGEQQARELGGIDGRDFDFDAAAAEMREVEADVLADHGPVTHEFE